MQEPSACETSPLILSTGGEERTLSHHVTNFKRISITLIEPVVFITAVGLSALLITVQNFYLQKVCLYQHGGDGDSENATSVCADLPHHPHAEEIAEKDSTTLFNIRTWLEAGPPILFGLFWGQLNDKWGSKIPLLIPMVGFLLNALILLILSTVDALPPALILLASLPLGLMGGGVAYSASGFKYVISITTEENQSSRIAAISVVVQAGQSLGTMLGSQVTPISYSPCVLCILNIMYSGALSSQQ